MSDEPLHPLVEELLTQAEPLRKQNTQLYPQNTLSKTSANDYYQSENRLFGDKPPNLAIKNERPEHRMIVYLKAQGLTNKEIADKTGYGYQWVCQITRQPWFRERFIAECEDAGKDAVQAFLKAEVLPSLETLAEIRDNPKAKEAARVTASNSILDRFLGKPIAKVEHEDTSKGLDDARATVEELERQVTALRQQNGIAESSPPQS